MINDCGEELDKFMLFDWHRELKRGTVDEEIGNAGCYKKYENRLRNIDLKLAYPDEVDNLLSVFILFKMAMEKLVDLLF